MVSAKRLLNPAAGQKRGSVEKSPVFQRRLLSENCSACPNSLPSPRFEFNQRRLLSDPSSKIGIRDGDAWLSLPHRVGRSSKKEKADQDPDPLFAVDPWPIPESEFRRNPRCENQSRNLIQRFPTLFRRSR
jgi:hypothetical protein